MSSFSESQETGGGGGEMLSSAALEFSTYLNPAYGSVNPSASPTSPSFSGDTRLSSGRH